MSESPLHSPLHSKALQCLQANCATFNAQACSAHQTHQGLPSLMPLTAPCPAMHLALRNMPSGMYSISSPGRRRWQPLTALRASANVPLPELPAQVS